uniref:Uncharacterized protein n=1 Tax=Sphaerodactylus townsendi TaxID=933632 RepID=A0ACB8EIL2_9SAUR
MAPSPASGGGGRPGRAAAEELPSLLPPLRQPQPIGSRSTLPTRECPWLYDFSPALIFTRIFILWMTSRHRKSFRRLSGVAMPNPAPRHAEAAEFNPRDLPVPRAQVSSGAPQHPQKLVRCSPW